MLKQGDCNNILTSEYSQLLGLISWAEIGFSYFVFNLLVILLNPSWVRYLCIMNLFTLPYTFWSIWYQKYKMKTWCILCLSVQCILGSYFITGLFSGYLTFVNFNFIGFGIVGCLFIFCIIIINLLSTLYQQAKQKELVDYPIFMAIAEEIGYDATGKKTAVNELDVIGKELKKFIATL